MNKKIIACICIVLIVFLVIFFIKNGSNKVDKIKTRDDNNKNEVITSIVKDEETGEYVAYDIITGDEIARSNNENDLHIYEIDPEFHPKRPAEIYEDFLEEF